MAEAPLCPETGQAMVRGIRPLTISYKDRSRTIEMPGWYCEASGESIHTREDMKVSDLALVTLKAEAQNIATPDEVREIRTRLGMTQAEAGTVLGGGVRAFQKYESGEIMTTRAMTNLIRLLVRHPEDVDLIRKDALGIESRPEFVRADPPLGRISEGARNEVGTPSTSRKHFIYAHRDILGRRHSDVGNHKFSEEKNVAALIVKHPFFGDLASVVVAKPAACPNQPRHMLLITTNGIQLPTNTKAGLDQPWPRRRLSLERA